MDSARDTGLYPPLQPFSEGMLDVGDGHHMYYELSGNPKGLPVVFVHGGPGAGTVASQRRYFNPDKYFIVLFDQRGAGKSTPFASLEHNTTDHLVADMETLRNHLSIHKWLVCGGSWGATLALAYGTRQAEHCLGFILRGIFLGTNSEVEWFLDGMGTIFPEHMNAFRDHVGGLTGAALFDEYCRRLFSKDPNKHLPAARAWARYESQCSTLMPHPAPENSDSFDHYALALARTEAHYFKHGLFLVANELMDRLEAIRELPAIIVQGRYDVVCPTQTAHKLHMAWPNSQLEIVADAGHSGMEPGIARAISRASDTLAGQLLAR
ncbi:MAG: prolyl aminopeptidase [Magnetovibrio sp.]|nr:prolyl aminopeptidase [Magnetovibrio sp.]